MAREFIDLGLPSGTLWAAENEPGYHQFDEAVKTFGDMLPSAEAWKELFNHCGRKWDNDRKGYILTGPNSNSIFLPAKGWQDWNKRTKELDGQSDYICVGTFGLYWSSSPNDIGGARGVLFYNDHVYPQNSRNRLSGFSVRLCKTK